MLIMNGYEVCKVVWDIEYEGQYKMFIIVLIVNVMVSDEKKCLYVGMDVFLIKFIN